MALRDHAIESASERLQVGNVALDLREVRFRYLIDGLARAGPVVREVEKGTDLVEREAEIARPSNEAQPVEVRELVRAIIALAVGDIVIVRPGERVPVDGVILEGQATLDQAAITGESMPVDAEIGDKVFAATMARLGYVKLRAEGVGRDTTFGRTVKLVEEAEANRGKVQRIAEKFSGCYLPIVAMIAGLTYVLSGNIMAAVAVLPAFLPSRPVNWGPAMLRAPGPI